MDLSLSKTDVAKVVQPATNMYSVRNLAYALLVSDRVLGEVRAEETACIVEVKSDGRCSYWEGSESCVYLLCVACPIGCRSEGSLWTLFSVASIVKNKQI